MELTLLALRVVYAFALVSYQRRACVLCPPIQNLKSLLHCVGNTCIEGRCIMHCYLNAIKHHSSYVHHKRYSINRVHRLTQTKRRKTWSVGDLTCFLSGRRSSGNETNERCHHSNRSKYLNCYLEYYCISCCSSIRCKYFHLTQNYM